MKHYTLGILLRCSSQLKIRQTFCEVSNAEIFMTFYLVGVYPSLMFYASSLHSPSKTAVAWLSDYFVCPHFLKVVKIASG